MKNVPHHQYRQELVDLLDAYLASRINKESVWQWAEEIICSSDYEDLPDDLQDAIHGVWLLHDDEFWVPDITELKKLRDALLKGGTEG